MRNYSILLVDDEEIIRETLGSNLRKKGFDVTLAENGAVAVERLNHNVYDLIITDLMMEGIDGMEVLKQVKERNADTMVSILTGYGTINSAIEALRLGADDYMLKPCDKTEMLLRISRCFERLELKKRVKLYEGILPVCCKCKKIRDDTGKEHGKGRWVDMEMYLAGKVNVEVSHTYCDECYDELKKDIDDYTKKDENQ